MTKVFSLAVLDCAGTATPAIEVGGQYWSLQETAPALVSPRGLIDLFEHWDHNFDYLVEVAGRVEATFKPIPVPAAGHKFLLPLTYPDKILATGANYLDHVRAVGRLNFNKQDNYPTFFMKPPRSSLVGPGRLRYPRGVQKYDFEVELAAVFGKRARHISLDTALDQVAAYTIGLDMSARDLQRNPKTSAKQDLLLGKCFDESCPLGPRIVPSAFIKNPQDLTMKLWVNGEIKQDSNTSNMIWSTAEQIVELPRFMTIAPGDVLLTGTPAGTGIETGNYLSVGDKIDAEVGDFGRLSMEVVEE